MTAPITLGGVDGVPMDRRQDRFAVAAAVCGAVGVVGFLFLHLAVGVFSLAAVVLGTIAVRRVASRGMRGRALATIGFLLGALGVMLGALLLIGHWVSAAGRI